MLRKFSNNRTHHQNVRLGGLTGFSAGMVNVASVMAFYAFASNITGHVAVLAEEIVKMHWYQVVVVGSWLFLFFAGNFLSNAIVIRVQQKSSYLAHAIPVFIELLCLISVGVYGSFFYTETLSETEVLVSVLLFSMGVQNGLTASITNGAVKTTHLTGLFTDLAIVVSLLTSSKDKNHKELVKRFVLLITIFLGYLSGGIVGGILFLYVGFFMFFFTGIVLLFVLLYDIYIVWDNKIFQRNKNLSPF